MNRIHDCLHNHTTSLLNLLVERTTSTINRSLQDGGSTELAQTLLTMSCHDYMLRLNLHPRLGLPVSDGHKNPLPYETNLSISDNHFPEQVFCGLPSQAMVHLAAWRAGRECTYRSRAGAGTGAGAAGLRWVSGGAGGSPFTPSRCPCSSNYHQPMVMAEAGRHPGLSVRAWTRLVSAPGHGGCPREGISVDRAAARLPAEVKWMVASQTWKRARIESAASLHWLSAVDRMETNLMGILRSGIQILRYIATDLLVNFGGKIDGNL